MSDSQSAKAAVATWTMEDIILELFLVNLLSNSEKRSLKEITNYMGYAFPCSIEYCPSDLFTITHTTVEITADNELLSNRAKEYAKRLIKKIVFTSKYEKDCFEYDLGRFLDDSYYTVAEQEFIDFMFNELLNIISLKEDSSQPNQADLFFYNYININAFSVTRKVYNDILQKKLHAGDNIISYFCTDELDAFDLAELFDKGEKYDCYYDKFGILKCDLETNKNTLIKNFLNTIIYLFRDPRARRVLLLNLNNKYPIRQNEKIIYKYE